MRTIDRIARLLFHVEMSVWRGVQQALKPSKRKDGRLWRAFADFEASRMLSNLDISVMNAVQQTLTTFKVTEGRDVESATFELTMRLYVCP